MHTTKIFNEIWNSILKDHGYIDKYCENQLQFHKNGFHFRPELTGKYLPSGSLNKRPWTYQNQVKSYKYGMQTDWQHPSATTEIHSLRYVQNAKAYLGKYVGKKMDIQKTINEQISKQAQEKNLTHLPPEVEMQIKADVEKTFKLNGRIWFVSQSLSSLKGATVDVSNAIDEILLLIENNYPTCIYYAEYCHIYNFSIRDIISKNLTPLIEPVQSYVEAIREKFPRIPNKIFSSLGIPLQFPI